MLHNCSHHWVKYDQELLGIVVGRYGCAYVDGEFDHLKDWIKNEKPFKFASLHPQKLVVAYVLAEDFKHYSYDEHRTHQKRNLDGACIRTPTINIFAKVYHEFIGENMVKANGCHPTKKTSQVVCLGLADMG